MNSFPHTVRPEFHVYHQVEGLKRLHCILMSECLHSCSHHISHACPRLEFFDVDLPQHESGTWYLTHLVYEAIRHHTGTSFPLSHVRFTVSNRAHAHDQEEIRDVRRLADQQIVHVWLSPCRTCRMIMMV